MKTDNEKQKRLKLKLDFAFYAKHCLKVRPKDGGTIPFQLNRAQKYIHEKLEQQLAETGRVRAVILKGRQQGASTLIEGRFVWKVTHSKGVRAYILTHEDDATQNLFSMAKRFIDHLPTFVKPSTGASNAKEVRFDKLDSGYQVGTAGNKSVGRSQTNQYFHGCLAKGSLVLTPQHRVVPIEQINVGDSVITHTGAVAPVSFVSEQEKECYSLKVFGSNIPVVSSNNHRYLTKEGWKELKDLIAGEQIGYPVRKLGNNQLWFNLKRPEKPSLQGGGSVESVPDKVKADYKLGRVLGLYLAEGIVKTQSKSGEYSAVCFAVHDKDVERTVRWLSLCGDYFKSIKVLDRKGCKTSIVTAYGKSFAAMVDAECGRVNKKQLPNNWWMHDKEFIRGLVHGYLSGDGHSSKRDNNRRITSPSIRESIAFGIRDALVSLGYGWATISYKPSAFRNGRNEKAQWILRLCGEGVDKICDEIGWGMPERKRKGVPKAEISGAFVWLPIQSIKPVGACKVYDLEVDHSDHSYCLPQCATHNSEVGFWPNAAEHVKGILQTIPDGAGSEVILESTANGVGNYFHQQWKAAESGASDFIPIFVPWFWQDEYKKQLEPGFELSDDEIKIKAQYDLSDEQIAWRRQKIVELGAGGADGEKAFQQEYPLNAAEAFQVSGDNGLITPDIVMRARKNRVTGSGPLIVGVDPSRGGDRFAMIKRWGRKAYDKRTWVAEQVNTLGKAVSKCVEMLDTECLVARKKPDMMFVDAGGGADLVDRLHELGYKDRVRAIYFGASPIDATRYTNRRNEIWGQTRLWMSDENMQVEIPDDDEMQADLCASPYNRDSHGRVVLWKKEKIKEKYKFSPDCGDALALTHAEPVMIRSGKSRRSRPNVSIA